MQGEVFGVEVFLDAFAAAFVAVPASFKASEGGRHVGKYSAVDGKHA